MSAINVPHNETEWLALLSQVLSEILNAAGEAGSNLFSVLWPHIEWAWNIARNFVIAHPKFTVALVILIFAVLLAQPLAKGIVTKILGFTPSGIQAGSIAAQAQAALYGGYVPAGSIFASLQSFGALAL